MHTKVENGNMQTLHLCTLDTETHKKTKKPDLHTKKMKQKVVRFLE